MGMDEEILNLKNQMADLQQKLKLLEERRGAVRESVYNKVKSDYEERLQGIEKQLKEKASVIQEEIKKIDDEIREISLQKEGLEEQFEEIDLRHAIGEYTDETYESMTAELKERIKELEDRLNQLNEDRKTFVELIGEAPEPVEEAVEEQAEEAKGDEFEITLEEVEEKEEEAKETAEGVLPEVPEEEKIAEEIFTGEEPSAETAEGVVTGEESVQPEVEDDWLAGLEKELGVSEEGTEEGSFIVCPRCGFKNKPDAWYCENCGAELSHE